MWKKRNDGKRPQAVPAVFSCLLCQSAAVALVAGVLTLVLVAALAVLVLALILVLVAVLVVHEDTSF